MYTVHKFFYLWDAGSFLYATGHNFFIIFLTNRSHFAFELQLYVAHR